METHLIIHGVKRLQINLSFLKDKHNSHKPWKRDATYVLLGTKEGQVYARATSRAKYYGYARSNRNVIWLRDLRSIYYLNLVADCQTLKSILYRIMWSTLLFNFMELRCESLNSRSVDLPILNFGDSRLSISSLFSKKFCRPQLFDSEFNSKRQLIQFDWVWIARKQLFGDITESRSHLNETKQSLNTFFHRIPPRSLITTSWGWVAKIWNVELLPNFGGSWTLYKIVAKINWFVVGSNSEPRESIRLCLVFFCSSLSKSELVSSAFRPQWFY